MNKMTPQIRFQGFTDDWEERKLGDEVRIVMGQSPNSENYTDDPNDYILVQGNADMKNGRVFPRVWTTQVTKQAEKDDLILSVRAPVGDIGKTAYDVVIGRGVAAIKGNEFIFQNLGKMKSDGYWTRYSTGSTFESINSTDIKEAIISVPAIEEQNKIGSFFKQLDNTIALHQRMLDLLKEQKKGFLQKMFPKNGTKVPELRFSGFADDWEERKFKDILKTYSFRSYLANASDHGKYEVIQQGDNPLVGYSDGTPFMDYKDIILFGDHTVSLYKPQSPFFISTDGVKILSADNFEGNYLYTTLERYKPNSQGYKRHFTILKNQELRFTRNVEEQQKVGSFFKQLDDTIALHQRKLDLLKEQKKGFLQKMFVS
ncbi:restriction endonuclease subunit S [Leuconostoc mesenteroides]|uniref:restriction endonuclease subunit S n=1 Tax=Leuconostoc mesenteroides TaxID=1245 RepID=UPI00235DEAA9|nr:restriction endonuclease subunit S [Leuconostoc mesenteroides]